MTRGVLRAQVMTPSDGTSDNFARIVVNLRLKQAGTYSVRCTLPLIPAGPFQPARKPRNRPPGSQQQVQTSRLGARCSPTQVRLESGQEQGSVCSLLRPGEGAVPVHQQVCRRERHHQQLYNCAGVRVHGVRGLGGVGRVAAGLSACCVSSGCRSFFWCAC